MATYSLGRRAAAWGVHAYTALGLPLAVLGVLALSEGDAREFWLANCAAVFVDATDGVMARAVKVREVVPEFDGRKLDDIVDFLTFTFLPVLAVLALHLFPPGTEALVAIPLVASGYGFCQERAKTDDAFVGFPSYWNVVVLYLWALGTPAWLNLALLLGLAALVFVPIHYVYPTKTKMLKKTTIGLGSAWAAAMLAVALVPTASWVRPVALVSLVFPAYYVVISLIHDRRVRAR